MGGGYGNAHGMNGNDNGISQGYEGLLSANPSQQGQSSSTYQEHCQNYLKYKQSQAIIQPFLLNPSSLSNQPTVFHQQSFISDILNFTEMVEVPQNQQQHDNSHNLPNDCNNYFHNDHNNFQNHTHNHPNNDIKTHLFPLAHEFLLDTILKHHQQLDQHQQLEEQVHQHQQLNNHIHQYSQHNRIPQHPQINPSLNQHPQLNQNQSLISYPNPNLLLPPPPSTQLINHNPSSSSSYPTIHPSIHPLPPPPPPPCRKWV